ncbi:MAG TPA: AEC family transporter [Rhizobiaceae bacterium]|nr:AEC family transporter [Rhizobiaceae bacterium]
MSPVIETILFIFGLVALGYLAGLTGYLKAEVGDGIAAFAVSVALPLLLFSTMANVDFHGAAPWGLWAAYFTAIVVAWTAGHLTVTRIFGRDGAAGVVGGVTTSFSNIVLLGIPFMMGVFGQDGFEILSLLISVHLPIMMMASIVLFQIFGRDRAVPVKTMELIRDFLWKLLTNPLVVGILCGLLWRAVGQPLPALASRFVDALADIASPLALFAVGLGLRKFGISGNVRPALAIAGLKLFLLPAVVLCTAWLFGLPPLTAKVAVAAAALPAGVNSYLIATQFGTGQALASSAMTIGTGAAVVTTAIWLSIASMVFG